jgi:alpha-beta hydrolase superfamily lysophospholipase
LLISVLAIATPVAVLLLAIVFGGAARPEAMASINEPFKTVDMSGLPPLRTFLGADNRELGYREYIGQGAAGSVTLVHGSSADSSSMHPLAMALAAAGYRVYTLDIRGHGGSGSRGHIGFIGQLESDLEAFVGAVRPQAPAMLAGFSSGGGFVLRFAASERQALFDSYLLLAPFLGQDAPSHRPDSGGWISVGVPRIIALSLLNRLGISSLNHLPVIRFALDDNAREILAPEYDFNLAMNFRPESNYLASIQRVRRPCAVLAGDADEAFRTDQYQPIVRQAGRDWSVRLLPGVGHIGLLLSPVALEAMVAQVGELQAAASAAESPGK